VSTGDVPETGHTEKSTASDAPATERSTAEKIVAAKAELKRRDDEVRANDHRPPRWWGAVIGVVAAGTGLAVGELVAGFSRDLRTPVVSVGDRVIDHVPKWMKDFAIRNFGTSDKTVLIWTILVIILITAVGAGIAAVRHSRGAVIALTFAGAFGLFGAICGGFGRNTTFAGVLPSLLAAAVAGLVLLWGRWMTRPKMVPVPAGKRSKAVPMVAAPDRRRFLATTGSLALGALVVTSIGRTLQDRFNAQLERAGVRPPVPKQPLAALPADPAALVENSGLSPLVTPTNDFYRIDTAIVFPSVSLDSWKLYVSGKVDKRISFTYDDLMQREMIERDITISCVSNEVGGDLIGTARWVGCRLDDLLAEAGIQSDADQVMGISVDGFTAGFPVSTLDGRDAMIALGMNGETLPVKNGFPARIIVPGIYGYVSAVKWLEEIKLTRFDQEEGYWVPRGWAALAPVKTQARIDRPGRKISAGPTHIAGVAWAVHRGIDMVEVQVDDGEWMQASLGPVLSEDTWVQWFLPWDAPAGNHVVRVRATDGTGETQVEERTSVAPDGATGWHTIKVNVS
jgi:DMSO/TMAO reductase YedYZ molybdopterin-dependent catalytic subunit